MLFIIAGALFFILVSVNSLGLMAVTDALIGVVAGLAGIGLIIEGFHPRTK